MALTSLVVCADAKAVEVLTAILKDMGIGTEQCSDPRAAAARLEAERYDAILIDCKALPAALEFIAAARHSAANTSAVIIGMVEGREQVRDVFGNGANFILYKPVSGERAASSLRAARGLMRREKRGKQRVRVHAQASIAYGRTENAPATLLDLSEDGLAIQSECRLPQRCRVYFEFTLPGQPWVVRLAGEVMWQDASGRVGIRFVDVPQNSRRVLTDWIRANLSRMEAEQNLASFSARAGAQTGLGRPASFGLPASPSNRLGARHACRLGADVYRVGSGVPNRCSLSDISSGGCYVEIISPFPAGAEVEIVVRTRDLKLRVHGTVRVVHPGFGMGVMFSLRTAHERQQVEQLIACEAEAGISVDPKA